MRPLPSRPPLTAKQVRTFWEHAAPEALSGCWLWMGPVVPNGYGKIAAPRGQILAHRVSYELHHGPVPDGALVRHKCDVPACVNPDHLCVGSYQDNSDDCQQRGRTARGEVNARSTLTSAEVTEIAARVSRGESDRAVAALFGVSNFAIYSIRVGRTWSHVTGHMRLAAHSAASEAAA